MVCLGSDGIEPFIIGGFSHATTRWINQDNSVQKANPYRHVLTLDSYHHLSAKYSVINTLRHRAKTVCSTKQLLTEEEDHLYNALR